MKGLFIPEITAEMFRNGCLESIEALIAEGEIHDIEYSPWIPINEKLPNFNDIVLASTDSDYDELKVILTVYSGEKFWFNGKIKAWMPLPEPYKAESEEI